MFPAGWMHTMGPFMGISMLVDIQYHIIKIKCTGGQTKPRPAHWSDSFWLMA